MSTTLDSLLSWLEEQSARSAWVQDEPHPKGTFVRFTVWSELWQRETLGIVCVRPVVFAE